ncbi:flagellar filament capping protein FliD [[Brevibacterium] frigoritolerans]|nr:flagellar filament capping protein FliD [Peribacillus frigoritolerans]
MASLFENGQITSYGDRMQIFGLGSQWDTKTILEAELNILQLQQKPYFTKKTEYESEKSIWSQLNAALTTFNSIVSEAKDLNTDSKTVTMSEEGFVNATATGAALDGAYSLSVQQLATKHRIMSDQQAVGPLGLNETVQLNGKDLTITADMDTKAIAKSINDGAYGVNAVVLDNRLVMTAKESGSSKAMQFSASTTWETLGLTQGGVVKNELAAAKGAAFTINGIEMTSETNSFNGIDGLAITFTKETSNDIEINVSRSADQVVEKVKAVVDGYNKIINTINSVSGEKGSLQGETIPRTLKKAMNNLLTSISDSGTMLYQLGISFNKEAKNGTISFDETKLRGLYETEPKKVLNLVSGENGFAGKVYSVIDSYSKSDGMISSEIKGLDTRIKRVQDTIDRYEMQFERQKESLIRKYATFETMMSSMTTQNDYIQSMLGNTNTDN